MKLRSQIPARDCTPLAAYCVRLEVHFSYGEVARRAGPRPVMLESDDCNPFQVGVTLLLADGQEKNGRAGR